MKTKFFTLTLLLLAIPFISSGQISLSGKVIDSHSEPLMGANIILIELDSNTILDGTITDEKGYFQFKKLEKGKYKVELSYLGFTTIHKELKLNDDTDLGTIILKEDDNQLGEIVITADGQKPIMQMKIDRTIFNVSQSDAAIGGNTIDALRITPGLKVKNSSIEMVGKGSVKLMINGREIRLEGKSAFEYLKSIPADQIDRIEMITNPPAKYTAEGSYGLINVVLKKGATDQFFGVVSGSIEKGEKLSHNENISLFYHKNGLQINGGANYYDKRFISSTNQEFDYPSYILNEHYRENNKRQGFGGFLESNYDISERTNIGINVRYAKTPRYKGVSQTHSDYSSSNQIDSILITDSENKIKYDNQNYSLYLDHKMDTLGSKLSGEVSYTKYKSDRGISSITENSFSQHNFDLGSQNNQSIQLIYAALDFELTRDFADYSFGVQASHSKNKNGSTYENPDLSSQNSHFLYDEGVYAVYFSGAKTFNEKWSMKLGLRSEYTISEGNSVSLNQLVKRDYIEFFPTAYLNYNLNTGNTFTFSYGRRIDRPAYRNLDPFRFYFSQYSYREGNPYLRPAYNNNLELKHLYKNKLSSALYFSYIPNQYSDIDVVKANSPVIANIQANYLETYKFGLTEGLYLKPFSWWESDNTAQVYYSKSKSKNPNTRPELSGVSAYFNTNNSVNINKEKTFRAHLNFTYYFPEVNGVNKDRTYYYIDSGVTGLFFSKSLTVSLNAEDIFKTAIFKTRSVANGIRQNFDAYYDYRTVRLSVSYKFGNSKNKKQREVNDKNANRI